MQNGANTLNLASIIEHHAQISPDNEAIVCHETRLTFRQLNVFANRVAGALVEMGIKRGDKVALACPNLPFFPVVYYGIMKAGAAVVPLNILFKPREIAYHLKDSDAKAVFVFEGTSELPLAQIVKEGFDQVETCENFVVMTLDANTNAQFENAKTLTEITGDKPDEFETISDRAGRYLRDSLHIGNDRAAERRGTDASESDVERDDDLCNSHQIFRIRKSKKILRGGRTKNLSDYSAAVSHDRTNLSDEHESLRRSTASFCCRDLIRR